MEKIINIIAGELQVKNFQVENAIKLIDEGNTIPFIARYRKEATGGLSDEQLRQLGERLTYLRNLEQRKAEIIKSIEEQGKLTDEILQATASATTLAEVEDIYRPYKQKKKTRATVAKAKGLEPLAQVIMEQKEEKDIFEIAKEYINIDNLSEEDKKNKDKVVASSEDAIQGALDIIAEDISDNAEYRKKIKKICYREGMLCCVAVNPEEKSNYEMYYNFQELVFRIPSHRILAINRGEKEEFLKVRIDKKEDKVIENNNIAQNNNFNSVLPISEISGNPINYNSNLNQLQLKQMTTQIISGDIDNISKEDNLNSQQPIKKTKSEKIVQINKNDDNFQKGPYKAAKSGNIEKMIKKKEYEIKFQVSRIDNKKENLNLYIKFLVNEKSTLEQIVNLKMENDFQEEWIWKFTSNDWINIDNNNENFVMKIDINKIGMKLITANVEKIKLGKPISFLAPNYIKFELTPIIKEINI